VRIDIPPPGTGKKQPETRKADRGLRNHRTAFIYLILTVLFTTAVYPVDREGRALWIVRTTLVERSSIDVAIEHAVEGGFETLFVQAVGRGDAFYPSSYLPPSELLHSSKFPDPLAYFVSQAHRNGLEVHVWINLLYVWSAARCPISPVHVVHKHPDWFVKRLGNICNDGDGRDVYPRYGDKDRFLSPALPEVRSYLAKVVGEIIERYSVEGIHLDYIRYPSRDSGFESFSRKAFSTRYLIDPVDLFDRDGSNRTSMNSSSRTILRDEWYKWRAEQITELLKEIRGVQMMLSPGARLSVAIIPDRVKARVSYGQDWARWVNEGIVDLVVTMSYSTVDRVVVAQAREAREAVRKGRLYIGVAAYNRPMNDVVRMIRELRKTGVDGFSFFSYNSMLEEPGRFTAVRKNLFADCGGEPITR